MYERSAVVLEKYFSNIFGFGDKINLKTNYKNFKDLIEEFQKYQVISEKEEKIINEFDDSANQIRKIQQEQKKLYKSNIKFEEERNQLFDNLDESPDIIEKKLQKIENVITDNNNRLIELKEEFTNCLNDFNSKQEERNSVSKEKRVEEKNYMQLIQKTANEINEINKSHQKPKRKWSYWSSKMYPKYQLLTEYFQISNSELYKNLYIELQNMYPDIDLNQIIDDYCYKNNLESAYTLDVIERDTTVRSLFEGMVDNLLERYNLAENNTNVYQETIFTGDDN